MPNEVCSDFIVLYFILGDSCSVHLCRVGLVIGVHILFFRLYIQSLGELKVSYLQPLGQTKAKAKAWTVGIIIALNDTNISIDN